MDRRSVGTAVSRRRVLRSACLAVGGGVAGCQGFRCNSDTRAGVGYEVVPTELVDADDGWTVTCRVVVRFEYASAETGLYDAALTAFGAAGDPVGRQPLGDLSFETVPDADRREEEICGATVESGRRTLTATVGAERFPRWLGLRYDRATAPIYYVGAEVAAYEGTPIPPSTPSVERYRTVEVESPARDTGVVPPFGVVEETATSERATDEASD